VITGPSTLAGSLLDALDAAVAPATDRQLQGYRRRPTESLNPPSLDPDFVERCRVAIAKLVAAEDEGLIAVSSARRGEGRSSVAAALALALSRSRADGRVLLLDLDFGHASQADLLSMAPSPGLADFLEGRERLRMVAGGPNRQLWHVPAGTHLGDKLRLFHVVASEGLLSVFRQRFQWVVLDLPPVLGHPETTPLLRQADWQLIVGRHRRTTLADLREVGEVVDDEKPRGFLLTADSTRIPRWIRRLL
jgi:polysaccharide biosynthesis transport protein